MRTRRWTAALVVVGLAIAGCGDDDDGGEAEGSTEDTTADETDGTEGGGGGDGVTMSGFAFDPAAITVAAGDTIPVTNEDSAAHTFTSESGGFDVEVEGGEAGEATAPEEPGSYDFVCRFHSGMQGTLTVE